MKAQRTDHGWLLRLDRGEEILESLRTFAREHAIGCALVSGIGAVGETELGFFTPATRTYDRHTLQGDHEILSLSGNLSVMDGEPFPHCHLIVCGPDLVARGGHLFRGVVTVTCEIHLVTSAGVLMRTPRPDLGFHPLAPDGA